MKETRSIIDLWYRVPWHVGIDTETGCEVRLDDRCLQIMSEPELDTRCVRSNCIAITVFNYVDGRTYKVGYHPINVRLYPGGTEPTGTITAHVRLDWEQRRYEAARSAMQGLLANSTIRVCSYEDIANMAIKYADALVKGLKRETKNNNQHGTMD